MITIQELDKVEESTMMMALLNGLRGNHFAADLVSDKVKIFT